MKIIRAITLMVRISQPEAAKLMLKTAEAIRLSPIIAVKRLGLPLLTEEQPADMVAFLRESVLKL
jgi:hypothetical protein